MMAEIDTSEQGKRLSLIKNNRLSKMGLDRRTKEEFGLGVPNSRISIYHKSRNVNYAVSLATGES